MSAPPSRTRRCARSWSRTSARKGRSSRSACWAPNTVAALLTVVGYSVHDTVIVSDRIRENMRKMRRESLARIINLSINETLSRTLITSGTAILVTAALFVLGGSVIHSFAFALLVGFVVGTYSSIYVASPIVLYLEGRKSPR